jgi:hypothetical protein
MAESKKLPRRTVNDDGSVTLHLKEPVIQGEEKISELKLVKPKAKHIKRLKLDGLTMEDMLSLGGRLAGQPPSVIDELCMEDTFALSGVIESFLPASDTVGKTA